jgi:hypothetical protein
MENFEKYANVGSEQGKDATEEFDNQHGTYKDAVQDVSVEERLPTSNMPKAQDPMPFKIHE